MLTDQIYVRPDCVIRVCNIIIVQWLICDILSQSLIAQYTLIEQSVINKAFHQVSLYHIVLQI